MTYADALRRRFVPSAVLLTLGLLLALPPAPAAAEAPAVAWIQGPKTVDLGSVAQLALTEQQSFAGASDARKLMEAMGNAATNKEVGLVVPRAEDQDWMIVFEYSDVGYVKDDDKDKIDADAILKGISEGTEEGNKRRKARGIPGLHVKGWFEKPHYDATSHNLVWALLAQDDGGHQVVNYNVRLLGRGGYMSVTLVDEPSKLAASKAEVTGVLSAFSYKSGKRYAEFRPGDKIAEYGLIALVAGGAGAAAAKLGLFGALAKLLAKGGKAIVLAVVALVAALRRGIARLFGRREEEQA